MTDVFLPIMLILVLTDLALCRNRMGVRVSEWIWMWHSIFLSVTSLIIQKSIISVVVAASSLINCIALNHTELHCTALI